MSNKEDREPLKALGILTHLATTDKEEIKKEIVEILRQFTDEERLKIFSTEFCNHCGEERPKGDGVDRRCYCLADD